MIAGEFGNFGEILVPENGGTSWLLPSAEEMAALDRATILAGTPSLELMERAGAGIAQRLLSRYPEAQRFVVLCGPGNNGGDGLVIARILREHGRSVDVVLTFADRYSVECAEQLRRVSEVVCFGGAPTSDLIPGAGYQEISEESLLTRLLAADVLVDALLGTGQRTAPRGAVARAISTLRRAREASKRAEVIAIDVPTGLDATTGAVFDPCVSATRTFSVECIKRGMAQFPGRSICGAIEVIPIGLSPSAPVEFRAVEGDGIPGLSPRFADAHKGNFGRVLVIGGSVGMPGAPVLAALGALRTGAGIVTRLVKRSWAHVGTVPECMLEMADGEEDFFVARDAKRVMEVAGSFDSIVVGPGLGLAGETGEFLEQVLAGVKLLGKRVVIDADAINIIAQRGLTLRGLDAVITPHPGEASRLLGRPTLVIQADRFAAVKELNERLQVVAVLKGAGTVLYGEHQGRVVMRGTPYLATAGSGDVLSGIIAACCIRAATIFDAASLGVWFHARAGISASWESGGPILASDIARHVAPIIGVLER